MTPTVVTLMGPTASGKTDLALALAALRDIVIISVDSAMVYRGMDIGTAKPSPSIRKIIPHELVDIRDPDCAYSVKEFCNDADDAVRKALEQGKLPVLVGGTMMYFKSFREGLTELPSRNAEIRAAFRDEVERVGTTELYAKLQSIDPIAVANIHPSNLSRLERVWEIYELTGQKLSDLWTNGPKKTVSQRLQCRVVEFAMDQVPRLELHARIEKRLHAMLAQGFVDEVKSLLSNPTMHSQQTSMKSVGYRQLVEFLLERPELELNDDVISRMVVATRRLARRQLVWLRGWAGRGYLHSLLPEITAVEWSNQIDRLIRNDATDANSV